MKNTSSIIGYSVLVILSAALILYLGLSWQFLLIPLGIAVFAYGRIKAKVESQFIQQFGASAGFAYAPSADLSTASGALFQAGHSQHIHDVLSGAMNGRDSRIFLYRTTIGYGKGSHVYNFTVFETVMANPVPHIVLARRNGFWGADAAMPSESEQVQLEGDFSKYFALSVPKGYEMEAYQIFTPDIMADLIDKASSLDFEFSGNRLYIYAPKLISAQGDLQAMLDLAGWLDGLFARSTRGVNVGASSLDASIPSA